MGRGYASTQTGTRAASQAKPQFDYPFCLFECTSDWVRHETAMVYALSQLRAGGGVHPEGMNRYDLATLVGGPALTW